MNENWIKFSEPRREANFRLFCFPYAGGGAQAFRLWPEKLTSNIEICCIQPPGRENRLKEPSFTKLQPIICMLLRIIEPYLDIPFAFFGHSLGALMCFELARQLRQKECKEPLHLFLSSLRAPHLPNHNPLMHKMINSELLKELRHYNGTPDLVLQEPGLIEIFLEPARFSC